MSNSMQRRDVLRLLGALGAAGATTGLGARVLAQQPGIPVPPFRPKKVLLVFLRGGWDGLNAFPASASAAVANGTYNRYKTVLRPDLHIWGRNDPDPAAPPVSRRAIPLVYPNGSTESFLEMHPALRELAPVFQAGQLAVLGRIGYLNSNLSHFSAQHFWETGRPQSVNFANALSFREGWVTRWASQQTVPFISASISGRNQRFFDTDVAANVQPHIRRLEALGSQSAYSYHGVTGQSTAFETHLESELRAEATSGAPFKGFFDERSESILEKALDSESAVQNLAANGYSTPVVYPVAGGGQQNGDPGDLPNEFFVTEWGRNLKDAAGILKNTSARVAGVEIGNWDHHNDIVSDPGPNMPHAFGIHQRRMAGLGAGLRAINDDFVNDSSPVNLLTVVMTEFGRTSAQNNSEGVDHARANFMLAMGEDVQNNNQVFNASAGGATPWTPATYTNDPSASATVGYIQPETDFRAVFEEVVQKHLGFMGMIDTIFQNYSADVATGPAALYNQLNFI